MSSLDRLADRWPAISALLDQALLLPAPARTAWVDTLSGDAADLKDTLRRLLTQHAEVETGDFLATLPKVGTVARGSAVFEPSHGLQVGPYRLVSELGRGGMGSVWLAERADGTLKRPVALKLPQLAWGGFHAERLTRERDILASLQHENIARLYDAGVDAHGRPYLAMELVEGEPIDAHCRRHALSTRQRLGLLLQVADAVAHAHRRLVVHRDLKPGNILVTADGSVRLLDFGVAKLLESHDDGLTRTLGPALTVDYASPEQIRGETIGTASDVYGFAVVAYEMLTGTRPYHLAAATAAGLAEAVAAAPIAPASTRVDDALASRELAGDIDAILLKALKKDSAERYGSVEAMADDLRRHLDGLPVLARPDTFGYRARKFVARHRARVATAGAVLVAVLAAAGFALWQAQEARLQAERARTEAATATAVQSFLESVFRANSSDQDDPQKARAATARQLLDLGSARIDAALMDAPKAKLRLLATLAAMYEDMDLKEPALALQTKRLALARQATDSTSDETVLALADLGNAHAYLEQREQAAKLITEARAILDARREGETTTRLHVDRLDADLLRRVDPPRGLAVAERAVRNGRARAPTVDFVLALQMLGENAMHSGEWARARDALVEVLRLVDGRPELGGGATTFAAVALGTVYRQLGDLDAASASYARALATAKTRAENALNVHFVEAQTAAFLHDFGRWRESVAMSGPAYRWARERKTGEYGTEVPFMVSAHGRNLVEFGRVEEGLSVLDEAARQTAGLAPVPDLEAPLLLFQAAGWAEQGRMAEAQAAIAKARALVAEAQTGQMGLVEHAERRLLAAQGRGEEAALALQQSDPKPQGGPASPRYLAELATLQSTAGGNAAAEDQRRNAAAALAAIDASPAPAYLTEAKARATLALGDALLRQGQPGVALPHLMLAAELYPAVYDESSLRVADAWLKLAAAQQATGDNAGSRDSVDAARRIHAMHPRVGEQHLAPLRRLSAPPRPPSRPA